MIQVSAQIFAEKSEEEGGYKYRPRPSSAGPERCTRQMVYHGLGFEAKAMEGRGALVLSDSSWHEELSIDVMRKSAFHVHSEQLGILIPNAYPFEPEGTWQCKVCGQTIKNQDCHGHIDWIATDLNRVDRLIEHKALSHFGFEGYMKLEEWPLDYFTQMSIYMRGLQLINPELHECVLLVKNKNQSGYLEFRGSYDAVSDTLSIFEYAHHTGDTTALNLSFPNITNEAFAKFKYVRECIDQKILPPRDYDHDHWRCSYCSYQMQCWKDYEKEHEAFATEHMIALPDFERLVKAAVEAAKEESAAKKRKDEVRLAIKNMLVERKIQHGFTTDYEIKHVIKTQDKVDTKLLTNEEKERVTVEAPYERLNITKRKPVVIEGEAKAVKKRAPSKKSKAA